MYGGRCQALKRLSCSTLAAGREFDVLVVGGFSVLGQVDFQAHRSLEVSGFYFSVDAY